MYKYAILPLALIFVGACDDDKGGDTGFEDTANDTDDPIDETVRIENFDTPGCVGGTWEYLANINGWTNGENLINAYDQGAPAPRWHEETVLDTLTYTESPKTERIGASLTPGAGANDYTPGVNTVFNCQDHSTPGTMVYALRIYDEDDNLADCIVFSNGYDQGLDEVLADPSGDFNPATNPSEISAANCDKVLDG